MAEANYPWLNWMPQYQYNGPEIIVKSKKNTYEGPYNHEYYDAQNGTSFASSFNEISNSLNKTSNKTLDGLFNLIPKPDPTPTTANKYVLPAIIIAAALIIIFFITSKK